MVDSTFNIHPTTTSKQFNDRTTKIHESIYNNLFLLSKFYPMSEGLKGVLKKDMFMKNNKTAFQLVVHYLLNILDAETFKKKITSWPIWDIPTETQFRKEILQYLNELNTIYEDADIPVVLASHLITPGGQKFAILMLKLSQLVVHEHLKYHLKEETFLHPIRPNKDPQITKSIIRQLKIRTNQIEKETTNRIQEFVEFSGNCKKEASKIVQEISQLKRAIEKCKRHASAENLKGFNLQNWSDDKSKRLEAINQLMDNNDKLIKLINEIKEKHALVAENKLEYKGDLKVPKSIENVITNTETINLLELLNGLIKLAERKNLELPCLTDSQLDETEKLFKSLTEGYKEVEEKCDAVNNELTNIVQQHFKI